jgi:nucleoside-diphosphate-sugar epimerase
MRVLVAGGTGAIGRALVPLLQEFGHDVVLLSRPGRDAEVPGVEVAEADALDPAAVRRSVHNAAPDAVVNALTAIPRPLVPRRFAGEMVMTNRLRTEGTANLVAAAGGARFVSEGLAFAYRPDGGPVADEGRAFWADGPRSFRPTVRALLELERLTGEAGGVVLRLGHLYGPGTGFAPDGGILQQLRAGRMPVVGKGNAMFSFIHTHDAATAIVAALDKPVRGALNVVDDEPTYARDWIPALAQLIGAPAPKHAPVVMARLLAGDWGVAYMNRIVGADNSRARLALDWRPRYPNWRAGFEAMLGRDAGSRTGR